MQRAVALVGGIAADEKPPSAAPRPRQVPGRLADELAVGFGCLGSRVALLYWTNRMNRPERLVGLKDITDPEAVNRAIAEFDELGREAFLSKYGFGHARAYHVEHNGELYDSKALIGVAHQYEFPDQGPLAASPFKGGQAATA